ncbi:MAG: M20 metallopeptidase family protein [Sarcina sp.]
MIDFITEALLIKEDLLRIRRYLHLNPELGMKEVCTAEYIKSILDDMGIYYYTSFNTGIVGIIKGSYTTKNTEKVIALRADMDALPIEEENNLSYKSQHKGIMHACGHDMHMAILLGAAKIINKYKDNFTGTVKLIFEPAEETIGGAKFMINEGVLKNPDVDIIVGLHVEETLECGKVSIKSGAINSASNPFKIKIIGIGGHGAYPHKTQDIIYISSILINLLQGIISREVDATDPAIITVGKIHAGSAGNIIPKELILEGIIRTASKESRIYIIKKITKICEYLATLYEVKINLNLEDGYPVLINSNDATEQIINSANKLLKSENVIYKKNINLGVESFAYFSEQIKSVFYFLGAKPKDQDIVYPAHSSKFMLNEECLVIGSAMQAKIAIDYLTK